MGASEPRQGADLKTQIGLFVEMSTPFFKVRCRVVFPVVPYSLGRTLDLFA